MYRYTTGWTKVHGIPWYTQDHRIQFDIECDEYHNKAYLIGMREWNLVTDEVIHSDFEDWAPRIHSDLMLGPGSFCSRSLKGEAFWSQVNADWQPVNQRIATEFWRFVKWFELQEDLSFEDIRFSI